MCEKLQVEELEDVPVGKVSKEMTCCTASFNKMDVTRPTIGDPDPSRNHSMVFNRRIPAKPGVDPNLHTDVRYLVLMLIKVNVIMKRGWSPSKSGQ